MAIAKFTDLLARGKAVPLYGTGQTRRDYTYIDDIVDGVLAALDLAPGFEIFNLGGSQTTTLIDLVHWIAEALEVEARVEMLPDQPGDVPITFADVSKAARMLGYSPEGADPRGSAPRRRLVPQPPRQPASAEAAGLAVTLSQADLEHLGLEAPRALLADHLHLGLDLRPGGLALDEEQGAIAALVAAHDPEARVGMVLAERLHDRLGSARRSPPGPSR